MDWFAANRRDLPWRRAYRPYEVWISEIMLQQTQMDRVVGYFNRWVELFPDAAALAAAPLDAVLKAWEGLGYYSRARNVHLAAQKIMTEHNGRLPRDKKALRALPGIGPYTAGAIAAIAFNQPEAAVDANVERVFSRLFNLEEPVKNAGPYDFIRYMAEALMPEPGRAGRGPREYTQSLMELGALVCVKNPRCGVCPVSRWCRAKALGVAGQRPVKGKKTAYADLTVTAGVLIHNGRIFIQKRRESGLWAGFWEFPGGHVEDGETPAQAVVREFMEETGFAVRPEKALGTVKHSYTRFRIRLHAFICRLEGGKGGEDARVGEKACIGPKLPGPAKTCGVEANPPGPAPEICGPVPRLSAATAYKWVRPKELAEHVFAAGHRKLVAAWFDEIRAWSRKGSFARLLR